MRFDLSEDQELLRRSTRDLLAGEYPVEKTRIAMEGDPQGYDAGLWRQLAEMGYVGLTLPERAGGQGLGAVELAVVCEEMGRVCLPGPYLDVVLAAGLVAEAGGHDDLVRAVVAGTKLVTIASHDGVFKGTKKTPVRLEGSRVRGTKHFVAFAAAADALVVETPDGVALVEKPFTVIAEPTLDQSQRFGSVTLDHAAARLGPPELFARTDRVAAVGAAATMLGLMSACLERTLEYVQTREAFRRPIGAFQALQHRMADMLLRTEATRSAVYRAAWCLDTGAPDAALACAAAKAYAGDSARLVCGEAIQLHGGIGFTWELDLHLFFKRAKTLEQFYGSTETQITKALAAAGM